MSHAKSLQTLNSYPNKESPQQESIFEYSDEEMWSSNDSCSDSDNEGGKDSKGFLSLKSLKCLDSDEDLGYVNADLDMIEFQMKIDPDARIGNFSDFQILVAF